MTDYATAVNDENKQAAAAAMRYLPPGAGCAGALFLARGEADPGPGAAPAALPAGRAGRAGGTRGRRRTARRAAARQPRSPPIGQRPAAQPAHWPAGPSVPPRERSGAARAPQRERSVRRRRPRGQGTGGGGGGTGAAAALRPPGIPPASPRHPVSAPAPQTAAGAPPPGAPPLAGNVLRSACPTLCPSAPFPQRRCRNPLDY